MNPDLNNPALSIERDAHQRGENNPEAKAIDHGQSPDGSHA
jgi:hypothetical protein